MRARFEEFVKRRRGLAVAILLFLVFALVFVMPKIFFSLEVNAKKMFWGTFLASFGIIMFTFFGRKSKKSDPSKRKVESPSTSRSYQQLIDEVERCRRELKKYQMWAYGCLLGGWIVLLIGKLSDYSPYNHPIFAIPVFGLVFLAATKSWEKENELDVNIAKCTVEGVEIEKKHSGLNSSYFSELLNGYEGWGMWQFAFIRVSPFLMIIFSLFNSGALSFLADHLSIPTWIANSAAGVILASTFLFFTMIACRPYYWMLEKMKAIPV